MDKQLLKIYLDQAWELLIANDPSEDHPILTSNDPQEVRVHLNKQLPSDPLPFAALLQDFEREVLPYMNHNTSPNFGAYITGSGNKVGALAEFIKAFYNQNGLKWNNSPIAAELEQLVIQWVAEFCQVPSHSQGVLTSGGSMSNLMAIHFALADRYPEREMNGLMEAPKMMIYCSDQTHSSVDRAMVFLGLGRNQLRKIPVNEHFQMSVDHLEDQLKQDLDEGYTPFMVIGNAGTTNTGSIDPLAQLADIASKYELWYHIDGAYGLPAIRLKELAGEFEGITQADSIIINPHKWMYVPFEASCVLLKTIPQAIHFSPDYLFTENPGDRWESSNHTIELSKEFRALKVWFTMKYYGADQLIQFVQRDIEMTDYLADRLDTLTNVEVEPNHPLSILCFRYADSGLSADENDEINTQTIRLIESEGKIFITGTKLHGNTFIRVYYGNPERTRKDVDYMVKVIQESLESVLESNLSI